MRGLKHWLRGVAGILVLVLLVFVVDLRTVLASLADIRAVDILYLALLSIALVLVSVIKWKLFLQHLGMKASVSRLFRLYLVGYFVNLFMPSSLGGDVVRSLYVEKGVDKTRAVSATLLERYTGLVAMVAMALIAVWWAPQATVEIKFLTVVIGVLVCGLTVMMVSGTFSGVSKALRLPEGIVAKVTRLQEGVRWGLSDRDLLVKAGALSVMFHLLTIVNTAVVAYAVGWESVPWEDLFVVVPLILLVGAVPLSPQGLGIQEGAFVFFLSSVGASSGQAMAVALVLRAKSYLLATCGGLLWLGLSTPVSKLPVSTSTTEGGAR